MAEKLSGYELSRAWFDFCFENPEKISPNHSAIFFFAIEHCNRLGWKEKFGFPTQMAMDAIGIKKHETYIRYFLELCEWGFFKLVERSVNQYSANIIALGTAIPKNGKALGKAILTHAGKQIDPIGESNRSINKPDNQITINHKPNKEIEDDFLNDQAWKEQFCMTKKIKLSELEVMQTQFIENIKLSGETVDNYKKYFTNSFLKGVNGVISMKRSSDGGLTYEEKLHKAI